jgi:3-dehydroquinate dehydratase II
VSIRNRVAVMHGVNLDQLGRRPAAHYGELTFEQLEFRIDEFGAELDLSLRFFHTNAEHEFVEELHRADEIADALLLNPGAWTHYSYAIRDALEIAAMPAIEVHLSDISSREEFRRHSVISDLCLATVSGQGPEGYREGLARLKQELAA